MQKQETQQGKKPNPFKLGTGDDTQDAEGWGFETKTTGKSAVNRLKELEAQEEKKKKEQERKRKKEQGVSVRVPLEQITEKPKKWCGC
jgi:hypothetical protein